MKKRILIIDDERTLCISMQEGLKDMGYCVQTALTGEEGLSKVISFQPHLVFLDLRLPGMGGLEVLKEIKNIDSNTEVIIMTAYADIKTAVSAIKHGALDYFTKPFELEQVEVIIQKAFENISLKEQTYLLKEDKKRRITPIIGKHPSMMEVMKQIRILARHDDATVLIRGETGTGKGRVAYDLHYCSKRKDKPFVEINCGTIPANLIESELFGFERNAFTGARQSKKGLMELADEGSVFLDEIGELFPDMQVKLLRFLEERRFKRIGGLRDIEVDVRIIAATNMDLEKAIERKEFREDLYYRLNVVPINLPPLRERGKDVILLAEYYLQEYSRKMGKSMSGLSPEVEKLFLEYRWPGNIRELRNIIERVLILYNGERLELKHLPEEITEGKYTGEALRNGVPGEGGYPSGDGFSLEKILEDIEKKYIREALEKTRWNNTRAAELLGISRYSLQRRIEKYFGKPGDCAQ